MLCLCFSFLAVLLLPPSLSCDRKRPPAEVRNNYLAIVQTDLENTIEQNEILLLKSSCPEPELKLHSCTSNNADVLTTLLNLTCRMQNLRLSHTYGLITQVLNSIGCPCPERSTEGNKVRSTRTPAKQRRKEKKKVKRKIRKLCKGKAILSAITVCYEMLNSIFMES